MPNIFVSYSHNDREDAELIIKLLTRFDEDYDIWWDFQIRSGTNWRESIKTEIRTRDIFIFLMSKDSMASEFCHEELRIAHETGRFLLPIVIEQPIDNSQLPEDVASYLNDYQYVDLSGDGDKSFELTKMFNALKWYEETIVDTSVRVWASEVAKAMNTGASHDLNIPNFNTAQTRRAGAVQFENKPPSLANRPPQDEAKRFAFMALLIGFVAVLFFGIVFGFSFVAGLIGSADATALFSTAVEARIMTRNANANSLTEIALSATATETQTPTIDRTATSEMQVMLDEQETEAALATSEQGTREASTATALLETQSAQLTADAPTNTPLPSDTPIPTVTATQTPSNTPTSTPNFTETAQFEVDASETAIAQETAVIIEQTSVYETAVAEQQAIATQAPTEMFPEGRLVNFLYNESSFYMQNTSENRIRLSRLSFQGLDAEGEALSDVFEGQQWATASGYRFIDGSGHCVSLEFWRPPADSVDLNPETCEPESNYNAILNMDTDMPSIFWRPIDEIAEFAVFWDEQEIARCPTETGFCEVRVGE